MRTTLDIADDVLFAAKERARQAFAQAPEVKGTGVARGKTSLAAEPLAAYGIAPLPARGGIVSNELIDRLRDAEGL